MAELYHAKKKKDDESLVEKVNDVVKKPAYQARIISEKAKYTKKQYPKSFMKPKEKEPGKISTNFANAVDSVKKQASAAKVAKQYGVGKYQTSNYNTGHSTGSGNASNLYSGIKKVTNAADEVLNKPKELRRRLNHVRLKEIVGPKSRHYGG